MMQGRANSITRARTPVTQGFSLSSWAVMRLAGSVHSSALTTWQLSSHPVARAKPREGSCVGQQSEGVCDLFSLLGNMAPVALVENKVPCHNLLLHATAESRALHLAPETAHSQRRTSDWNGG